MDPIDEPAIGVLRDYGGDEIYGAKVKGRSTEDSSNYQPRVGDTGVAIDSTPLIRDRNPYRTVDEADHDVFDHADRDPNEDDVQAIDHVDPDLVLGDHDHVDPVDRDAGVKEGKDGS